MEKLHSAKDKVQLLETIEELENRIKDMQEHIIVDRELMRQLIDIETLKCEVHSDIEKVWMYDTSKPLNEVSETERIKLIERVFYKVANQWDYISDQHDNDEWGEMIPLPGSRMATKEEIEKWDKIKLPF